MIFVSDRIEKIASSYPELTAIITEDETTVSYQQLNSQADRLAEMLIDILNLDNQSNFNETQMVGLLMERTIAIVTMFLAVHKAGCGYVPVDPAFPPDRQSYILEHSKCNVLIVDEECFEGARKQNLEIPARNIFISDSVGRIIKRCVDGREIPLNHGRRTIAPNTIRRVKELNRNAEAIAYVLYTSGSTGKPKGVAVKQIGVDNIIKFFADELEVGHSDCVMGLTTFCFDISVLETFVPLTRGATFLLAKSATRKDPFHIIELIEQHKVTVFQATPTTYEMMLATGWTGDERVKFLVGGEAFRPTILPLARKCSDLLNVYGPTETTIWSTFYRVPSDFDAYARSMNIKGVPIGKAISDTTLYLVEETQPWKQVPFGKEGELFIGGIGVAAGYLHAPHLTKERFIANPFGEGFVYRTGDSVKQLSDGNYIFMRRLDDQVKIDGFRIELEEIEKVFMQHEIVDKAVALVRDKKLVIYIQPKPQTPVKTVVRQSVLNSDDLDEEYELENDLLATILDFASKHLTYYMMPKYTMIVKEFPKTPNGKLDKKALPNPRSLLQHVSHEQTEKRSENETLKIQSFNGERPISSIICEAVHQLRGVRPQVGSSLSAFGLDSLGSVMLLRHLSTALQGEISIKMNDLFAVDATIKSIGQLLYSRANESVKMKLKLIPERDGDEENVLEEGEEDANNLVHRTDYFGAVLLSNRRLMDGLRGVFTLMVLFNHWHSSRTYLTSAFNVDTTLFYMISGFTTASQLRILPVIKKEKDGQLSTEPKPSLDLWNFFLIRAVGLYPILWISLLINAPTWQLQDKYQYPNHVAGLPQEEESAVCTFLYMIGMNVWTQTCTRRGPDVRYASGLIITMMIYALLRFLWTLVLRHFSSSTDLISLATRTAAFNEIISLKDRHQSWKEYLGKLSVYLSYNLYHPDVFWLYIIPYGFAVFLFSWQNTFSPIKLVTSVEYFGMCACLLVICEMMCGRRILRLQQQQREKEKEEIRLNPIQKSSTPLIKKGQERSTNIPEDLSSPWDEVRLRISPFVQQLRQQYHKQYQSFFGEISDPDERTMFLTATKRDKEEEEVELKSEDHQLNRETRNGGERRKISEWLWRFSPDLIMLFCMICFYLLSCYDEFCQSESIISLVEMALVPIAFLLYLTIALYQRGKERYNLSRLVLESDIMNKIGYASYPVYLIQNPFLQFYFTYVIHYPDYAYHPKQPGRHYFQRLPFVYRFTGILIVIVTGWLIQKYFQDWFITNLFTRLLSHWKSRRNNIPSQKRSI